MQTIKIVKYNNRKLYSLNHSKYITLVDIGKLLNIGHVVEIKDFKGNDITNITLISVFRAIEDDLSCTMHYNYDSIVQGIKKIQE